jgi:carboxyl-terminal processing protease
MRNERFQSVIISIILIVALYAAGFHAGQKGSSEKVPAYILNATSTEGVDMAPYWKVWNILEERFAPSSSTTKPTSAEDKIWTSIEGLAASYNDPYTVFFPPVESKAFEEDISGSFGGVGMEVGIANGALTVIAPLKDTPAYNAGVKAGDKILFIGETATAGMTTDEAIKLIRGEVGTEVVITFGREGEETPLVKRITRATIDIPTVNTKIVGDDVFVIELYNFSANSPGFFRRALREFIESKTDKLVVDLRNNPGGYLEAAIDMASWFLPTGKVVVTEDFGQKQEPEVYKSKGYDIFNENLKMAILVNEGSASASEIFAGAMREYGKAVLIGETTFGKGSVQELIPVTDNTSLKVTVAHWLTPNGNSISDGGLTPDIEVESTALNTKDGNDPVLDEAVKYLKNKN